MVKFVAKKSVDFETLEGLKPVLFNGGSIETHVQGTGFEDADDGMPATITDIDVVINGEPAYSLSKMKLKVSVLLDGISPEDLIAKVFKGNDKIIGSNKKDTLIGFKGDDTIKGNNGKDTLLGDKGDDTLKGGKKADVLDGGKHDDMLNGGSGLDTYQFTSKPGKGVDTIKKFEAGETIALDNHVFAVGSEGALGPNLFHAGSNATTSEHRIVYRENKGKLYYDEDGSGGADKELFAKVDPGTSLDAGDFMVI